jgi:hypothetical protein
VVNPALDHSIDSKRKPPPGMTAEPENEPEHVGPPLYVKVIVPAKEDGLTVPLMTPNGTTPLILARSGSLVVASIAFHVPATVLPSRLRWIAMFTLGYVVLSKLATQSPSTVVVGDVGEPPHPTRKLPAHAAIKTRNRKMTLRIFSHSSSFFASAPPSDDPRG